MLGRSFSTDRLISVKNGKRLAEMLKKQKKSCENILYAPDAVDYNSIEQLLYQNINELPRDISQAMKQYYSTRGFSPDLERKKMQNLENFFLVRQN